MNEEVEMFSRYHRRHRWMLVVGGVTAALSISSMAAEAQAPQPTLTKAEARGFIMRGFRVSGARVMLKDERAEFFSVKSLIVEPARRCERINAATVSCSFRARLDPDAAHKKAHWFPIRCRGAVKAEKLEDGRLKGTMRDYVCRTVLPKK